MLFSELAVWTLFGLTTALILTRAGQTVPSNILILAGFIHEAPKIDIRRFLASNSS